MTHDPRSSRRFVPAVALILAALSSLGNTAWAADPPRGEPAKAVFLRKHSPTAPARQTTIPAHLAYLGGPVIPNVKVHALLWGPNVDPTITSQLPAYFNSVTQSPWLDLLAQYATLAQQIGRGGFGMMATDPTPIAGNVISDYQIQTEIAKALDAQLLPQPDLNSVYFVMFPPGVTIVNTDTASCVEDGFCAYHSTFRYASQNVAYAVVPDFTGGCSQGCGTGGELVSISSVMSHELAESITDPVPNSGWYDASQPNGAGEIADICDSPGRDQSQINGNTVQYLWSNADNACVPAKPPANDFSINVSTTAIGLALGATKTVTITTAVTTGVAEPLTINLDGATTGLTASVSPTTINSGDTATLTLTAAADATATHASIEVSAAIGDYSRDTAVNVTVGTPADFSLAVTPTTQTLLEGGSTTFTVTPTQTVAPIGDITLSVPIPLLGVTTTFSPATIPAGSSSTLTMTADGPLILSGTMPFKILATAGQVDHVADATVVIVPVDAGVADASPPPAPPDAAPTPVTPAAKSGCAIGGSSGSAPATILLLGILALGVRRRRARA